METYIAGKDSSFRIKSCCRFRVLLFLLWNYLASGDWGLKDMGRSYFDEVKKKAKVIDTMNVEFYTPIVKNSLCETQSTNSEYTACQPGQKKLNILVVDQLPVMATQLGCGKRMFHLLEAIIGLGHTISLSYLRPDKHETPTDVALVEKLGVPVLRSPLLVNNVKEDYRQVILEVQPDVVIFTLWYWQPDKPWFNVPGLFMTYTRKAHPGIKVVVLTDDVHWLRLQMLSMYKTESGATTNSKNAMSPEAAVTAIRMSEYANYGAADAVITISLTDKESIIKYDTDKVVGRPEKLFVVPFVASPWETIKENVIAPFNTRSGLIFVGNMVNPTNIEGLKWFLQQVLPMLIDRDPAIRITIVGGGGWTIDGVEPIGPIRFVGWLSWEQMRQELNSAKVFVSPIVVSTGVNTKNALAMSNGIPLVTTSIGASGLCNRCDESPVPLDESLDSSGSGGLQLPPDVECPFVTAQDVSEFARAVMQLYKDELLWNMFSKRGLQNIDEYLSVRNEAKEFEKVVSYVFEPPLDE